VIYRPKVVVLGIGCNWGTEATEIETVIRTTLELAQLSIAISICLVPYS